MGRPRTRPPGVKGQTVSEDYEVYAALQADAADEARAQVTELRQALTDEVMARAGFVKQEDGTYVRQAMYQLTTLIHMPLSVEEATERLRKHGIGLETREVPALLERIGP